MIDRLSIRSRPRGLPLMRQNWGKLLFMHWPINAELLRLLIPSQLAIDTFDGSAWIGEIPFTMLGDSRLVPAAHSRDEFLSRTQRADLRKLKRRARRLVLLSGRRE